MIPNPGSGKAIEQGCTCCPEANRHGKGLRFGDFYTTGKHSFWPDYLCPLHGRGTKWGGNVGRKAQPPRQPEPQTLDAWAKR